jgi:hypothetical protein
MPTDLCVGCSRKWRLGYSLFHDVWSGLWAQTKPSIVLHREVGAKVDRSRTRCVGYLRKKGYLEV